MKLTLAAVVSFHVSLIGQDDPIKLLGAKDVASRLRAIALLEENGHPRAEELLLKEAQNRDWEIQQRAVEALGKRGSPKSVKVLAELAIESPLRAIRDAAARSIASLDRAAGVKALAPRLKGEEASKALDALALVGAPECEKAFRKAATGQEPALRAAAIRALGAMGLATEVAALEPLLADPDVVVQDAAAAGLALLPGAASRAALLKRLGAKDLTDVMERSIGFALRAHAGNEDEVAPAAEAFKSAAPGIAAARLARLLGTLAAGEKPRGDAATAAAALRDHGLASPAEEVRAASAAALGALLAKDSLTRLGEIVSGDASPRVRFHALRAAAAIGAAGAADLVVKALGDGDAAVREEAAVLAGGGKLRGAAAALRTALDDKEWTVMLAAAVSLGKLQDEAAVAPLAKALDDPAWQRRGAAAAGLGWSARKEALPRLIAALDDKDPVVQRTALDFLRRVTGEKLEGKRKAWLAWWEKNADKFRFVDRGAPAPSDDGYDRGTRNVYEAFKGLDVIVLAEDRDQIQDLLKGLDIAHTMTSPGKVGISGIHPHVVFLVNCPGRIDGDDSERLSWLVRSGAHLMSSCWGLTNTVAKVFPGIVSARPQTTRPAGAVDARPAAPGSPRLENVFDRDTRPLYQLAGYQIVTVHDRERVEVLIDSPEAASFWGEGNLAAWFTVGHGVVMQSTNHFALQGMKRETLKTDTDRMAFARERLGIPHVRLRELRDQGAFTTQAKAAAACDDLTIMRLVARFVQLKRRASL